MIKKILSLAVLSAISTMSFAQDTSVPKFNQDFKVSAQIDPGCFLEAENINFGVLQMPLQDQSTSANMKIHCSKGASLSIAVNYGDTISSNTGSYTYTTNVNIKDDNSIKIYKDGNPISSESHDIFCHTRYSARNELMLSNNMATELNVTLSGTKLYTDIWGLCSNNINEKVNKSVLYSLGSTSYGVLNGLAKGEQIKFSLSLPTNQNTVWNNSTKHNISGTGIQQIIPMNTHIKRSNNPSHRMTPDTYQSTVIIILTY